MNITRHNYEEFFLLYTDNELDAAARIAVEKFVQQNPDLEGELRMLQHSTFSADNKEVFINKEMLMKTGGVTSFIHPGNYEEFFVLYIDDELTNGQKAAVEQFVYSNPQFQEELELLQQVKLTTDAGVFYHHKESLYRKEKDDKVVPFRWWRIAAAAIVLLIAGMLWLNNRNTGPTGKNLAGNNIKNNITQPVDTVKGLTTQPKAIDSNNNIINMPANAQNIIAANHLSKAAGKDRLVKSHSITSKKDKYTYVVNNVIDDKNPAGKNITSNIAGTTINNAVTTGNIPADVTDNKKLIIDQPGIVTVPSNNTTYINAASTDDADKEFIINTSVNKKNSLRGLFRKASRFIEKTTNIKPGGKGILIGGFEIAAK